MILRRFRRNDGRSIGVLESWSLGVLESWSLGVLRRRTHLGVGLTPSLHHSITPSLSRLSPLIDGSHLSPPPPRLARQRQNRQPKGQNRNRSKDLQDVLDDNARLTGQWIDMDTAKEDVGRLDPKLILGCRLNVGSDCFRLIVGA